MNPMRMRPRNVRHPGRHRPPRIPEGDRRRRRRPDAGLLVRRRRRAGVRPGQDGRHGRRRRLRAQCVRHDRHGQHGHRLREAPRDGPGHLHRAAHARRRGARLRVVAGPRDRRAGRRVALRESLLGHRAGHRRLDGDRQLVRAVPAGGSRRARDAGRRRGEAVERPRRLDPGEERRRVPRERQEGDVRRARERSGAGAGAGERQAQGSEGLRLHRQARAAHGLEGEVERHRAVHAGREAARTC